MYRHTIQTLLNLLHQVTAGEKASKYPTKKGPASKPPPKPPKEKIVKPKKEVVKPAKPAKPDPTVKAKAAGHQPGVIRGITYYKAAKMDDAEHGGSSKGEGEGRRCSWGLGRYECFLLQKHITVCD